MTTVAVYAGSFDPVTHGHMDLIHRAAKAFDKLYVAVGVNSGKQPLFTVKERMQLIRDAVATSMPPSWSLNGKLVVDSFPGLLVDYCKQVEAKFIIRGLRAVTDFEAEMGIADANRSMVPEIETFFIPTQPKFSFVSSSTVREIARHPSGTGWASLDQYVPPNVLEALLARSKVS